MQLVSEDMALLTTYLLVRSRSLPMRHCFALTHFLSDLVDDRVRAVEMSTCSQISRDPKISKKTPFPMRDFLAAEFLAPFPNQRFCQHDVRTRAVTRYAKREFGRDACPPLQISDPSACVPVLLQNWISGTEASLWQLSRQQSGFSASSIQSRHRRTNAVVL